MTPEMPRLSTPVGLRDQRAFWPMHDSLFRHQEALEDEDLLRARAGARARREPGCHGAGDGPFRAASPRDFMSGIRSGVNGTPTFFVNSVRYDGPRDADSLTAVLEYAAQLASRRIVTRS